MSDSLFRGAFSNPLVARQFLSAWLPKVFVDLVDWSSLEVRKIAGINEALAERREDVVYRLKAADLRGEEVRRIVEETIPPEEKEQFMSTAEMLKEEGRAEGRQEGRAEGRAEGRQEGHLSALRDAIFDLLETRFTEIPAEVRESVLQLNDLTHLRQLVRRAGVCASLKDFAVER